MYYLVYSRTLVFFFCFVWLGCLVGGGLFRVVGLWNAFATSQRGPVWISEVRQFLGVWLSIPFTDRNGVNTTRWLFSFFCIFVHKGDPGCLSVHRWTSNGGTTWRWWLRVKMLAVCGVRESAEGPTLSSSSCLMTQLDTRWHTGFLTTELIATDEMPGCHAPFHRSRLSLSLAAYSNLVFFRANQPLLVVSFFSFLRFFVFVEINFYDTTKTK